MNAALRLAEKLQHQRRRLLRTDGRLPSSRHLAARSADTDGTPTISHAVISDVLAGNKANPPLRTLHGLARAFDVPAAYLLPGWDDLTSLQVYRDHEDARQALRLIAGLGPQGAAALLESARGIRANAGLGQEPVAEVPDAPLPTRTGPGRPPRTVDA
ncbi:hypothetical protein [Kitasatospora sp. NPDC094015]|uniref:hypothetical protein n=1 Tax=Kitasatospora sp. NPDC094015 TaxID=3155205 RepID=UPI0033263FC9